MNCIAPAAFVSGATARGFDQKLAHGAGGDALEMQARRRSQFRGVGQLQPGLVHEGGGIERATRIASLYGGREAAQFFVSQAKQVIERASLGSGNG